MPDEGGGAPELPLAEPLGLPLLLVLDVARGSSVSRIGQPSFTFQCLPLPPALPLGLPLDVTLASDDVATGASKDVATGTSDGKATEG